MKDEANIVEQYADSDVGKRIEILIRYYPNFIRQGKSTYHFWEWFCRISIQRKGQKRKRR